jgi:Nucleotidyl transferase of unknown function (DUF2204)
MPGRSFGRGGRVNADQRFRTALASLAAALEEIPAQSMIIGGMAVIAAGVPRQTIDIDATILGRDSDLESVVATFARHGIGPRIDDAVQFARERQVLLLEHQASGVTMEISFAWLPFEEEALAHALSVEVEGIPLRIARPEDLVVYKAAAWRDRDRSDIERLLALHFENIDLVRVRALVDQIGSALDDPGRITAFDAIVERIRNAR